ncbi:MAG: protoheme IX farnesyltransferase [Paludibacter sp.]|nr:protoheme IX farnesyltransferase [Paludibacter sp.]
MNYLRILFSLIKYKVSLAVTFTAVTGYIVFSGNIDIELIELAFAVFVLASGSSALNECQEWKYDARMQRTLQRPIPAGRISVQDAFLVSFLFIFVGLFLLYFYFGVVPLLLGLFNIFWYNGFYTNLKRISAFAVVPGSLVGAVPVLIGWSAAGGFIFDQIIVSIAFFLFIWQVPHFWLLMMKYGEEYEEAGFPTINRKVNSENLKKIIFVWIIATSFSSIVIPLFLLNTTLLFFLGVFALNVIFVLIFTNLSFGKLAGFNLKRSFVSLNIYMFLFMILLIFYHLFPV